MLEKIERELNNLISWFGQLHMKVEALETKVYGVSLDQSKLIVVSNDMKSSDKSTLKPDCPGYTECKEMLFRLQRENNELKKLNQLTVLELDKELQETDIMIAIRRERDELIEEKRKLQYHNDLLQEEVKDLTCKLDSIFKIVTNTTEHKE